jgi:eukaryotic-like serine/threonine-protein kinase
MPEGVTQGQMLGGKFRLTEPLAADPLLEVWLAEDVELQRDVVVKVLHPRWMDDDAFVERFRFEALAAARLDHENVARTYDVEHADGALFTVSEHVAGPTVFELLELAPLPPLAVAAIGQQIASGLHAAHEAGMVHGAICPQNLVVSPHGRVCLIDFGSVRGVDAEAEEATPDPVFPEPRTRLYWPPERLAGHTVDHRGDVYSAGLVMWEALTGTREVGAAPSPRPTRRLLAALRGTDNVADRLRRLLVRATAEDPEDRFTAGELAEWLIEICGARPQDHVAGLLAELEDDAG